MQAGDYPLRIDIEQPTETRTTLGGQSLSWSTFVSRWARFIPRSAREYVTAAQAGNSIDWIIECPGYAAITNSMRVSFDSRYFDIHAVYGTDGKSAANAAVIRLEVREGPTKASS